MVAKLIENDWLQRRTTVCCILIVGWSRVILTKAQSTCIFFNMLKSCGRCQFYFQWFYISGSLWNYVPPIYFDFIWLYEADFNGVMVVQNYLTRTGREEWAREVDTVSLSSAFSLVFVFVWFDFLNSIIVKEMTAIWFLDVISCPRNTHWTLLNHVAWLLIHISLMLLENYFYELMIIQSDN